MSKNTDSAPDTLPEPVAIAELVAAEAQFAAGNGEVWLYENMPDEIVLKTIKNAARKAKGAPFTVQMFPDWNDPADHENLA